MTKRKWTQGDRDVLLKLKESGLTDSEIAAKMDRSLRSISSQLWQLNADGKAEKAVGERVGCLDIEASGLKSTFGICLSWCIADLDGNVTHEAVITKKEIQAATYDKRIIAEAAVALRDYDRIITWNGERFDLPFLRTRAMFHNLKFPGYRTLLHNDALLIARRKMATLHSKRLGAVCEFLGIPAKDHPLVPSIWLRALSGNKEALNFILTHNREDVVSLAAVWNRLKGFSRVPNTSI